MVNMIIRHNKMKWNICVWLLKVCSSCRDVSKISLENETNGVQPMLGNRCIVGNTAAQMSLTNWGLSGIAGKRKQHLGPLSSCHGDVGGVLPETGVLSSSFTDDGMRAGNHMVVIWTVRATFSNESVLNCNSLIYKDFLKLCISVALLPQIKQLAAVLQHVSCRTYYTCKNPNKLPLLCFCVSRFHQTFPTLTVLLSTSQLSSLNRMLVFWHHKRFLWPVVA